MKKRALTFGCLGMDGSLMCELLADKGYEVYGVARINADKDKLRWIEQLVPNIKIYRIDVQNKSEINNIIRFVCPTEIYNFLGVSNTFQAWDDLDYMMEINARVPQRIMETILYNDKSIKFFQASSCLTFGRDESGFQNENTPANPTFPYGAAKLYAQNMVKLFREDKGLFACSGILFPHEHMRRGEHLFTKKITSAVARIKNDSDEKIKVGDLTQLRDWSWAPDVVEACWMMLQADKADDYVVGSGITITTEEFVKKCFEYVGLNYKDHIEYDEALHRKNDFKIMKANTAKIEKELDWSSKHSVDDIIRIMISYELEFIK